MSRETTGRFGNGISGPARSLKDLLDLQKTDPDFPAISPTRPKEPSTPNPNRYKRARETHIKDLLQPDFEKTQAERIGRYENVTNVQIEPRSGNTTHKKIEVRGSAFFNVGIETGNDSALAITAIVLRTYLDETRYLQGLNNRLQSGKPNGDKTRGWLVKRRILTLSADISDAEFEELFQEKVNAISEFVKNEGIKEDQ